MRQSEKNDIPEDIERLMRGKRYKENEIVLQRRLTQQLGEERNGRILLKFCESKMGGW